MQNPVVHVAEATLSPKEEARLQRCENAITQAERGFWDVGKALREIHGLRLYRPEAWDKYCLRRWEFSAERARQFMAAAEVMDNLSTAINKKGTPTICRVFPANESQARALVGMNQDQQWEVWKKAVIAGRGRPTGVLVAKAVESVIGRPPGAAPGEVSPEVARMLESLTPEDRHELLERKEEEAVATASREEPSEEPGPCERWGKVLDKAAKMIDEKDQWGQKWVEDGRKHFLALKDSPC